MQDGWYNASSCILGDSESAHLIDRLYWKGAVTLH